ncbi:phosphoribosyl-AMP cyclohydrolase [Aidingimonas lacisalsi]|uniref:phosphoribosyl-AMP cyclohydrolase n=1 Tax=Aidingimonas lacisalsi TaxID=2604086 RepID=UPI0011D21091|nr:phosphoribosyl-AMP cyclohydrolase [Aidingimonas lacisalsi]
MSQLFKELERDDGAERLLADVLDAVQWNADGLLPAIAQQHDSGEVLMMAWMNRDALEETLRTQRVCYWSRSRAKLWRKGESSGQEQRLKSASLDCDGDTLLLQVEQDGPACHTGRRSCFYVRLDDDGMARINQAPMMSPETLYADHS